MYTMQIASSFDHLLGWCVMLLSTWCTPPCCCSNLWNRCSIGGCLVCDIIRCTCHLAILIYTLMVHVVRMWSLCTGCTWCCRSVHRWLNLSTYVPHLSGYTYVSLTHLLVVHMWCQRRVWYILLNRRLRSTHVYTHCSIFHRPLHRTIHVNVPLTPSRVASLCLYTWSPMSLPWYGTGVPCSIWCVLCITYAPPITCVIGVHLMCDVCSGKLSCGWRLMKPRLHSDTTRYIIRHHLYTMWCQDGAMFTECTSHDRCVHCVLYVWYLLIY